MLIQISQAILILGLDISVQQSAQVIPYLYNWMNLSYYTFSIH
jgi:hypothetical protein